MNRATQEAIEMLSILISNPSVSRDEKKAADFLQQTMEKDGYEVQRIYNNLTVIASGYKDERPSLLLNAHIDTVRPVSSWSRDPFIPVIEEDRLYGLGSNDCGGGLVSLWQAFKYLSARSQKYNIIFLASAEEEVSGVNGLRAVLPELPKIDLAIVGEPTGMQPAVAERGLMVLDITSHGVSGHAARNEGVNAIYLANEDLNTLRTIKFDKVSDFLGPTVVNVTMIQAGTQHNVVPDKCTMVADVRTNELYSNEEVFEILKSHLHSEIHARSFHLRSSHISPSHPIIRRLVSAGMRPFGSSTLSDQALMPFTSFKWGPGDSSRSHSADEYILISEIENAITTYINMLDGVSIV